MCCDDGPRAKYHTLHEERKGGKDRRKREREGGREGERPRVREGGKGGRGRWGGNKKEIKEGGREK